MMGPDLIRKSLTSGDGHPFEAMWLTPPAGRADASIVLLHEIFGLTTYIEELCHFWVSQGYNVLAPALFDRFARRSVIDYSSPAEGLEIVSNLPLELALSDIKACIEFLRTTSSKVGIVGYCWGGGLAYRTACEFAIDAAACVYPTRLLAHADRRPKCSVQFQFAERDKHATEDVQNAMVQAAPEAELIVFSADHAFDRRAETESDRKNRDASRNELIRFFSKSLAI